MESNGTSQTFALHSHQSQAATNVIEDFKTLNKTAIILGTGGGKTEIFIEIAKRFRADPFFSGNVLVLSHLDILTRQTANRFALRAPDLRCGILQGQVKPHVLDRVVISTMQSSRIEDKADYLKARLISHIGLIIVDEAHHIQTENYQKILGYFPTAKVLGVTATPFRDNALMTNYFDKISFSMSLQSLIDGGYIVRPELYQIERKSSELEDIVAQTVDLYKRHESGKSAIIFMKTKEDSKILRNAFCDVGIPAESVTCNVKGEYRDDVIKRFNAGDIKVLTTVNVLTAGFDSPAVESIWMPYSVKSVTQYVQRIGRGLRLCPEKHKTKCNIYVFGSAPSISKKFYEKVHNLTLNQGGEIKEYETVTETLEYNEWDTNHQEYYKWNQTVAECVRRMEKLGMLSLSERLNRKDFPKRFLENVTSLLSRLPESKTSMPHGAKPITEKQTQLLTSFNFTSNQLAGVTKAEASMLIGAILGKRDGEGTVKTGRFAGKHVSELPFPYRSYVLKTYPDSELAIEIRRHQK